MKKTNFLYVGTASAICCALLIALYFLIQTAQPSADVVARIEAQTPRLSVDDFAPGDVGVILLDSLPIIVWRRNESDKALAASQDAPDLWKVQYSKVLGHTEPVLATDENLTLNGEWFFAIAEIPESPGWVPLLRTGNYGGFFDVKYAGHYDLAGRIRHQGRDNLTVVMAEMLEDGKTIQLDLRR